MSYKFLRNYIVYNKYLFLKKQNNLYFSFSNESLVPSFWLKSYFLNKVFSFNYPGGLKYSFVQPSGMFFLLKNNSLFDNSRMSYLNYQLKLPFFIFFSFFRILYYFRAIKCY